jgi:hypothetical protein
MDESVPVACVLLMRLTDRALLQDGQEYKSDLRQGGFSTDGRYQNR